MIEFRVKFESEQAQAAIKRLAANASNMRPFLNSIASVYIQSTEQRFESQTSPSGRSWKRNTADTARLKARGMRARPPAIDGSSHVGVWSGRLASSIRWKVVNDSLFVGSDLPYAPFFQRGHRGVAPWGNTPGRPFLGATKKADTQVQTMLKKYLESGM